MSRKVNLSFLMILLAVATAFPIDKQNANWLLYEEGNVAMDRKEFGQALKLFKEAIINTGIFPEAEVAIGDVYIEEGELELAIDQYEKAYNIRKSFYIPETQYDVLYKLSRVYENMELYKKMEDSLSLIVADDIHFQESTSYKLRSQIDRIYMEKGLDRVMLLYSFDKPFSAKAHSKLGWFYYRTGRYSPSITQLLFAIIYRGSQIKDYLKEKDAEYQFSTIDDLNMQIEGSSELKRFAEETGYFADLYYLAGSMYANGYPDNAKVYWKMISKLSSAGKYKDLSTRQLKKPWLEPLIHLEH